MAEKENIEVKHKLIKCKFCGAEVEDTEIIFGTSTNICIECVELCNNIIENKNDNSLSTLENTLKPTEIKQKLDEYIIGQDRAKKIISVAVYNHYKRILKKHKNEVDIQKSNIVLLGPTGCGKTLIVKTIASLLNVPLVVVDATSLTQAGYVGGNVEDMLTSLIKEANDDIKLAEHGIIFIDEIDKIASKDDDNRTRDVSGKGVQQSLLKIIEGTEINISGDDKKLFSPTSSTVINTKNILFIVGGSFDGLDKIISERLNKNDIGFGHSAKKEKIDSDLVKFTKQEDLVSFGLIPEFIGRLQVIAVLQKLSEESLVKVLKEPKDSLIKQYQALLEIDNIKLDFEDLAIKKIARIAMKRNTGARGLKSIIEDSMLELMYYSPTNNTKKILIKEKDIIENFVNYDS